jgi:type I restriction-modification system DNA methylase subunit
LGPQPEIRRLAERFEEHREAYLSTEYNETQLRREFLDPFFIALGWDVQNKQGYAEPYKDVVHEDTVKIGTATKAPDYSFRIGGFRKFFVEAKRPSVNLKEDISPAYQVRRYAWSCKLPLSILTDFEEFAVYDCRIRPHPSDKPSVGRVMYVRYSDYVERWEELASIFSRDSVLKGSFDKYVESTKGKKGTAEVDDAFLKEIEGWREMLAKNIALRNPKLDVRELNFAVQRTIDRIIFLRICEDRGIETYGSLLALQNGTRTYKRLCDLFYRADEKYNSGLFHFSKEKDRPEPPDEFTPHLDVDDKPLKEIIKSLYYPESSYEFSVMPADILGQVYEQFLGKVIRLTAGHQAKVEDKPEVKKTGGVYYTPTYIVDYIVKNAVGRLLTSEPSEGSKPSVGFKKTPKQASKLRILDPACGSGSFLIGAYQYLLDWHRDRYVNDGPEKWATGKNPTLYHAQGAEWRLTTAERKRILLNNIYGVDIDPQAVEVTKLSLLLKVLEGENEQTLARQLKMFHERALPDLSNNIKCGNSLIGPDFYDGRQLSVMDDEERLKINAFDWKTEFKETFDAGGFDVVIGNPPYGASLSKLEYDYLKEKFASVTKDVDTYSLFMEHCVRILKIDGLFSMIVPTGWYSGSKFSELRRLIASETDPVAFVNLPYDIFKAWVDTTIFVAAKRAKPAKWPRKDSLSVRVKTFPKRHRIMSTQEFEENVKRANFAEWFVDGQNELLTYTDTISGKVIRKIMRAGRPFSEFADIQRGVTPFNLTDNPTHAASKLAFNGTVRRYVFEGGEKCFIRFDNTLAEPKPERYFCGPRLLLRELISRQFRLQAVKVTKDFVTNKSMQSILQLPGGVELSYLLGLINSRLISWYFLRRSNVAQRDDFPKIVLKETRSLPICPINFSDPADKTRHDRMVALVEEMLELDKKRATAKTEHDQTALKRQIEMTDKQIDELVYDLYGLTEEERKIVEES